VQDDRFTGPPEDPSTKCSRQLTKHSSQLAQYTTWLMFATVLLTVATVWTAYSTEQLRKFAEQQAKDVSAALQMTRSAIVAANRQAGAVEAANDISNETSKKQLRAYISQQTIETENSMKAEMTSIFYYKNTGLTPGIDLRFFAAGQIVASPGGEPFSPPYNFQKSHWESADRAGILGGGSERSDRIVRSRKFNDIEIEEFRSGKKVYVVWGEIHYADIFGTSHYLRFCKYFERAELARSIICATHTDGD
jgi:hypothetical protein